MVMNDTFPKERILVLPIPYYTRSMLQIYGKSFAISLRGLRGSIANLNVLRELNLVFPLLDP